MIGDTLTVRSLSNTRLMSPPRQHSLLRLPIPFSLKGVASRLALRSLPLLRLCLADREPFNLKRVPAFPADIVLVLLSCYSSFTVEVKLL